MLVCAGHLRSEEIGDEKKSVVRVPAMHYFRDA